jgi:serine phosphatase RsbU (regulator of sigma subunit)
MQKDAIHQQKTEIEKQRDNIKKSNMALAESNTQITDSIEYAKRIQLSLLPTGAILKKNFEGSFVLYFPKDIVSGDFYWVHRNADQVLLAVVDCTGHGVHGAFITILSHSLLNQIMFANNSASPDRIISELDILIRTTLNQQGITLSAFEGMDIAVCSIHLTKRLIEYAGAKMPIYIWQDNQLQQIDGERFSVGGNMITDKKYNLKTLPYHNGDLLYMATDGFQDQFGGSYRKKFMKKHFRTLLNRLSTLPIEEQPKMITEVFNSWKGDHPQTDDILILGIKL